MNNDKNNVNTRSLDDLSGLDTKSLDVNNADSFFDDDKSEFTSDDFFASSSDNVKVKEEANSNAARDFSDEDIFANLNLEDTNGLSFLESNLDSEDATLLQEKSSNDMGATDIKDSNTNLQEEAVSLENSKTDSKNLKSKKVKKPLTKKQKITYIVLISIISLLTSFFVPSPFNIIINYLLYFIVILKVFKVSFLITFIATILPAIFFSLVGNLTFNPYLTLLGITYEEASTIIIYRLPYTLLMYLIVFLIVLAIKYFKFSINILNEFDKKNKSILITNFIFGMFTIIVQLILTIYYIDILPLIFTFFNFICLLLYYSISLYSLLKVTNLIDTTKKLESAEEYNKTLHILHDSVRGFKHDFDNIVTTIGGYIKTNDMDGLEKYYSQLVEDCEKVNNLYILNPDIINNPGVYNLLTTKYAEAEENDIKVNLTFLLDLNQLHMKIYEFARILGILLDNAIDAASECDEKILNIVFRNDSNNNRNIILIENTFNDKNVNLDDIFKKGVTGKTNHTGLGLWEIKKILKKNNNINLYTTKDEQYFSQQLEIYY